MKRGLVVLDPDEVPPSALSGRVQTLQHELVDQGVTAALSYGDVYRSGDITYLSNICIYWNEAVLAMCATGEPALLAKLSPRVHTWMRATSNIQDLRSGPSLARLASQFLEDTPPGVLGLLEMDWWPGTLIDDLRSSFTGWEIRDLGPLVRRARREPSASELELLGSGGGVSARAVLAGSDPGLSSAERAGRAELSARMGGVEDVYVHAHAATDEAETIEVVSEYRGYWTTAARVLANGAPDWLLRLCDAYAAIEAALQPGVDVVKLRSVAGEVLQHSGVPFQVDLIDHTDLETSGDYRSPAERLETLRRGAVVALRLELDFDDGTQAVLADTYEIVARRARRLTSDLAPVLARR